MKAKFQITDYVKVEIRDKNGDLEDNFEKLYWEFDALKSGLNRHSERDAFKMTMRSALKKSLNKSQKQTLLTLKKTMAMIDIPQYKQFTIDMIESFNDKFNQDIDFDITINTMAYEINCITEIIDNKLIDYKLYKILLSVIDLYNAISVNLRKD